MRTGLFLLLLILVIAAREVGGSSGMAPSLSWPSTPAATRLRALVDAYNTGDSARVVAFVRDAYPQALVSRPGVAERIGAHWTSVWREFGPGTPFALRSSTPRSAEVWMRGDVSEAWFTLEVRTSDDSLHTVASGGVGRGVSPPMNGSPAPLEPQRLASELARYVERMDQRGVFSGAILVARGDRIVYRGAAGLASREHGVRNRVDTRFNIASVSKTLTAAAVLRLAAAGRIGLDDPIARFELGYPRPLADRVTVRHLLTHASGIELDDDSLYNREAETARSLTGIVAAQVRGLARHPQMIEAIPAREFNYTNEGFDLAGAMVEKACGRPFAACLDSLVLAPAAMHDSGLLAVDQALPGLASGYTTADGARPGKVPGPLRTNHLWLSAYGRPSGQLYSTVDDLWRFSRALRGHRLMSAAFDSLMLSPQILVHEDAANREEYGLGVQRLRRGGAWRIGHSGGLAGASSRLDIYPELDYTVIVLANQDWTANNVADRIAEWLGAGFSAPPEFSRADL